MTMRSVEVSPTRPIAATGVEALLRHLTTLPAGKHHVLSCYVPLTPQDRAGGRYLIELKDRIKALETDPMMLGSTREERLAVGRDLDRIQGYLSRPQDLPPAAGVGIFACEEFGLFSAVALGRVHRTRMILDDTPRIAELVASEREAQPILAVVADRTHARFFEMTPLELTELSCLTAVTTRGGKFHSDRHGAPGWNERDYHRRLEHERHRHYANVVQHVEELLRSHQYRGFVLAGPKDHISALVRFLPNQLSQRLLGTAKLNPTAVEVAEIRGAVREVVEEHDREHLAIELAALNDAVGNGWAVNGPREALRALHRGQARSLFIRGDLEGGGYRCSGSRRLVLSPGECPNEGEPLPVRDLVDEAIEEALRKQVQVVMVPDGDMGEAVDGLAATLRFR